MDKICRKCQVSKPATEFYLSSGKPRGSCKECTKTVVKAYVQNNKEKVKTYGLSYYDKNKEIILKKAEKIRKGKLQSGDTSHAEYMQGYHKNPINRAKWLHKRACVRSIGKYEFTLSLEKVIKALENGYCEKTGLEFDFGSHQNYHYNPRSPSLDRIDSSLGYTDDNCQIVCTWYNLAKMQMTDQELLVFCRTLVNVNTDMGV